MANYYWIISYEKESQNLNICHYIYCRISNQCPNKDYVIRECSGKTDKSVMGRKCR